MPKGGWNKGLKGFQTSGSFPKGKPSWNAGQRNFPRERFTRARYHCQKRGKSWELTFEQYAVLTEKPCHYCGGILPKYGIGLDRKDGKTGYIFENVVPCCSICNDTKGAHITYDEMCMLIVYRKKKQNEASWFC